MLRTAMTQGVAGPDDLDIQPRRSGGPRRVPVNREARTARIIFWSFPILVVLIFGGGRLLITSKPAKAAMAKELAARIANRTKAAVRLGGLTFGWAYQPCLKTAEVYRVVGDLEVSVATQSACVERWPSAVGSGFRAVQMALEKPAIKIVGAKAAAVVAPLADVKPSSNKPAVKPRAKSTKRAALREVGVVFDDLSLDWSNLPIPNKIASGTFGPIDGRVTIQKRGPKAAATIALREPITGLRISGRATPSNEGWDLTASLEGDLAPTFGELLKASGLDIRKLPVQGEVGVVYKHGEVTMDIDMTLQNVDLANRHVSTKRLSGFTARQKIRISADAAEQRVWIEDGLIEVNGIPALFSLDMLLGGDAPSFLVGVELKTVPMVKLLRSIPGTEAPTLLDEMSAEAQFAAAFTMSGQLRDPQTWQPKFEHQMVGIGSRAQRSGLEFLLRPFEYYPLTKTGRSEKPKVVGPGTASWVPYTQIPYMQRRAIQVSEDANFWLHNGVDIEGVKSALVDGLSSGDKARGGSTLSQQLVKNLFLTRDRTAMRKLLELVISLLVESSLEKEQIFELYANIIEWGPGIYGLREAAYYYFGKSPRRLSTKEMAYLASIIPGPLLFHKYYLQGWVPPSHLSKVNLLLERLRRLNTIKTDEELKAATEEKIRFFRRSGPTAVKPGEDD